MPVKAEQCLMLIMISVFLPSCQRLVNWGKGTFNQACPVEETLKEYKNLIRSTHVYNQLSTLGIFDAVILTPELLEAYNKATKKNLKFSGQAFFVLAFADKTDHKPLNSDSTNQWAWHVSLWVDGKRQEPKQQKCITLPAEFKLLFGKKWSQFKSGYLVEFGKIQLNDTVTLCFNSLRKKTSLEWDFKDGKVVDPGKPCCFKKGCEKC